MKELSKELSRLVCHSVVSGISCYTATSLLAGKSVLWLGVLIPITITPLTGLAIGVTFIASAWFISGAFVNNSLLENNTSILLGIGIAFWVTTLIVPGSVISVATIDLIALIGSVAYSALLENHV